MKADRVVSCDWGRSEGVWYLDSLKIHWEAQLLLCLSALHKHTSEKNWDTLMRNIQQHVEACYLTGSSESREGKREGAGEGKLKQ